MGKGPPVEAIGKRLRRLRLERRLSQRDLSSPGVSYAYISRIEAGARSPSVKALRKLAERLGVSVDYLETGRDIRDVDERELRLSDAELAIRLDGDTAEAERTLAKIVEEARRAGDHASASRALIAFGFAAARRGNHLAAVERLEAARDEQRVSPHMRPDLYETLGQSYAALGAAADRAVPLFEQCLEDVQAVAPENTTAHIRFSTLLSYALADAGEHERAASVVRDALERAESSGASPHDRVRLFWALARAANTDGRHLEALTHIRRAIALLEATDDTLQLARGYLLAAGIEAREHQLKPTRTHLERAEELLGTNGEPRDVAMLRIGQSWLASLERDGATAVARAREALEVLGDSLGSEQGTAVWMLARGLALEGDETGALDAFRRAVDLLVVHGRRSDAGLAAHEWATFLREHGHDASA
ncbi:MAG TPA: helix-turn-helix transcriptional regulator, partial [Gaiellaceae bacterium]